MSARTGRAAGTTTRRRVRARVEGTVQGVGFRPFVYRLAGELGLDGAVWNDARGAVVELEGDGGAVETFLVRLPREAPALASVERLVREEVPPTGERGFTIAASAAGDEPSAAVSPDAATCEDCLAELRNPDDRRFRYPFVNCTNCGPRFTIVRGVPYDRPLTTMAGFAMCARCQAEYEDPADRRFHAQPNACPVCGPQAWLADGHGRALDLDGQRDAVEAAAQALRDGLVVAVKGVGGFHLACRADDEGAVAVLRSRKHREDKPFALMACDLWGALALVALGAEEEALLVGRERPIVLAPRLERAPVAPSVAPGSTELGVMLPYSPLHHVLMEDFAGAGGSDGPPALVMTSGNVSDEPIAYGDEDALARLTPIADRFLLHDRPIHTRTDDSVVRVVDVGSARRPLVLRRSRGFVPASVTLPVPATRPVLACGAELKSTFCVAKGTHAWVSHHVGDLKNYETLVSFREGVEHFERLFAVAPEVVAHDLHPDYLSTGYALEREGVDLVGVQHHHAHLAACLAEHGERGPAVGAIYDGTGYGTDGTVWGGELLVGDLAGFERAGHLRPVRMPGGERAVREPWRMACAWLVEAYGPEPPLPAVLAPWVEPDRWGVIAELARTGFSSPVTTSAGRLFDAVAALCGLAPRVNYEGQAAVELEAAADASERGAYPLPISAGAEPPLELDARETVRAVAEDLARGTRLEAASARFHNGVAAASAHACATIAERHGLATVVLSGGVFQNRLLLERTAAALTAAGLRVLVPERLPPNDGGISYGQAAVAARRGVER
ncbi:MAG: carbamoyltransferase HypF [Thermoleophilaceae bacterium]|nr:carbamoyltransferase HypF [Thermoleophilaceae bacterium]